MIVTFSNLIESKGVMEGEIGDLSENMSKTLRRDGSIKEGEEIGLCGVSTIVGGVSLERGQKSSRVKAGDCSREGLVRGYKTGSSEQVMGEGFDRVVGDTLAVARDKVSIS